VRGCLRTMLLCVALLALASRGCCGKARCLQVSSDGSTSLAACGNRLPVWTSIAWLGGIEGQGLQGKWWVLWESTLLAGRHCSC
jgi:hypothetical protein